MTAFTYDIAEGELMTLQEVCKFLRVSKSYIYSLTHRHLIPHIKIEGMLRFRRKEIDRWLKAKEVVSVS